MKKLIFIFIGLFLISCDDNPFSDKNSTENKSDLTFSLDMSSAPEEVVKVIGTLSRFNYDTIYFDFTIMEEEAISLVENIPVGEWILTVEALNNDGFAIYKGTTSVTVEPGATKTLYLHLDPTTGNLRIIVTWGDFHIPIAYYPFNNNANDMSKNGYHGEVFGAQLTVDRLGHLNSAFYFDGQNDYINLGYPELLDFQLDDFTISLWFKCNLKNKQQHIIRKGYYQPLRNVGRWVVSIDSTDVLRIIIDDKENDGYLYAFGKREVTDNEWHHLVLYADRDQSLKVYLDKILEINDKNLKYHDGHVSSNNNISYIGKDFGSRGYFKGSIDDIVIWRSLVSFEVIEKY